MRYLSVCSGIEAATAAWHGLGWQPVAFSEIEPFPSAVLAHHYPTVPNWGDMTKYKEWPDATVDLLAGGTPCQSFSVAGLRKGLADPRGNLMLTFGAVADKYRPTWLVWENVPGVLSSNGGDDFKAFLDMLESLGYVCDVEILDAQFFGVPQRRRRVFVCAQHRDDLLSQKTDTSALTIAQCLQEILLCILSEARSKFGNGQGSSDLPSRSKDGAKRRMELFGLAGEADCWPMLLENLVAAFRRLPQEQKPLGATHGEPAKELMPGVQSTDSQTASLFTLTEQSLKNALDEALEVMRLFITSTETSSTTQARIFSCSRAALLIAKLTQRLSQSSPAFWSSALSSLTAVEEFTDYARSTSSDLFGDLERLHSWIDFIEQAEHSNDAFLGFGVECFGEIFPLPDCLQGHPAPSRKAGKEVAGAITAGAFSGGAGARPEGAAVNHFIHERLPGEGFDASEDGTGRGTPLVPVAFPANLSATQHASTENLAPAMGAKNPTAVAMALRGRDGGATAELGDDAAFALRASSGGGDKPHVLTATQVRRLTPTECERLMGAKNPTAVAFPINTQIATRHKKLGNGTGIGIGGSIDPAFTLLRDHSHAVATDLAVRRLTPRECERLQGFPPIAERVIIQLCSDHQSGSVLVDLQCLRWQTNASPADASVLTPYAATAEVDSSMHQVGRVPLAVLHVQSHSGREGAVLRSHARSNSAVNGVNEFEWSHQAALSDDIAHGLALTLRELALLIRSGKAASRLYMLPSTQARSGSALALMSGDVIAGSASAAKSDQMRDTFITSELGLMHPISDSKEATLCCSALNAIAGYIPEKTLPSYFSLEFTVVTDYTSITVRDKPAADGPRYKALGNSMAVPCMRWIGERIQQVSEIAKKEEAA